MMITMVKILRANAKALTTKKPESAIAKGLFNSEKDEGSVCAKWCAKRAKSQEQAAGTTFHS